GLGAGGPHHLHHLDPAPAVGRDHQGGAVLTAVPHRADELHHRFLHPLHVAGGAPQRRPDDVGGELVGPVRGGELERILARPDAHAPRQAAGSKNRRALEIARKLRLDLERHFHHSRIWTRRQLQAEHRDHPTMQAAVKARSERAGDHHTHSMLPMKPSMQMPVVEAPESKRPQTATADRVPIAEDTEAEHKPFVPADKDIPELTPVPLSVGALPGILFGPSSMYLVLKVGLTVSASTPVAVLSITIFRGFPRIFRTRRATILENNITQTAG